MRNRIIKFNIILLCFITPIPLYAGIGLADWSAKTPGSNEINNFSGNAIYLKNGDQIDNLNRWFFYKNHIIGEKDTIYTPVNEARYFVVDETTFKIDTFLNKDVWTNYLAEKNLKPKVWTRWYSNNWIFFSDDMASALTSMFYLSIPLVIFFLLLIYKSIKIEKLNFTKPYTLFTTFTLFILLIIWLLDKNPQSL